MQIALRKRPVEPERIDQVVSKMVRELESQGEVSPETVGEMVMETLRALDDVAYVRFASVYRNFREAKDFEAVLDELSARRMRRPRWGNERLAVGRRGRGQGYPADGIPAQGQRSGPCRGRGRRHAVAVGPARKSRPTGTKFGCRLPSAGPAPSFLTVPLRSCSPPVAAVGGAEITTIEGLSGRERGGAAGLVAAGGECPPP